MPSGAGTTASRRWLLAVIALAIVPVHGLFTTSRIFFVRDLSFFFWSRHLWLRHTVFGGELPWWDPYVAGGQSAIADALNQLVMPITLAIRLLPSDVVSFNLWVALPLPIAAAGTFAFLRRRVSAPGAALGACVFALSGPVVSMLNTPNLSWSVAFIPWVLSRVEVGGRRSEVGGPRFVSLAVTYALQGLCGEPVTWVATGLLAGFCIFRLKPEATTGRNQRVHSVVASALRRKILLIISLGFGALLASMQMIPTLLAGVRAHRSAVATPDFWSLHPLSLWEALAPNLFGNYYDAFLADLPWMAALNFGRDPFFYSFYVGPLVLLLAVVAVWPAPRKQLFWLVVTAAAVFAALGGYTPVYPLIRKVVPSLMYFRFPVKYFVFAMFAVAVLAAEGLERVRAAGEEIGTIAWLPLAIGGAGLVVALAALAAPGPLVRAGHWLAVSTHLKDPALGAAFLARSAPPLAARFFALLLGGGMLLAAVPRRRALAGVLAALVVADLAITNTPLNITMDVARLAPPAWYTASSGVQRVYVGGRFRGYMNGNDPDGVKTWQIPAEGTAIEGRMELNAQLPMAPSGWRVREAVSYDLPYLWPFEYEATLRRFEEAGTAERAAFLRRSAVRRCVLPDTETRQFRVVADVPDWNMRVFECDAGAARVVLASSVAVAADPADLEWQREGLFDPALAETHARLQTAPRVAGTPGPPADPAVRIVGDRSSEVVVEAALRTEGVLLLRDTYDPSWRATVDGEPAEIVRANGIHRAVALPPGRHVIRFSYRPRDFFQGLIVTVLAGLCLCVITWVQGTQKVRRGLP